MFSGDDEDGNKRKVSSYEFKVKGRSGIEVGRIAFGGDYSSQNFIEFCNNKESEQTISMTCELDPEYVDFTVSFGEAFAETFNKIDGMEMSYVKEGTNSVKMTLSSNLYFFINFFKFHDNFIQIN